MGPFFDGLAPGKIIQAGIIGHGIIGHSLVQPDIRPGQAAGKVIYTDDFFHQDVIAVFIAKHFRQWIEDLSLIRIFIIRQKDILQYLMLQQD